jgi:hypothetical protein
MNESAVSNAERGVNTTVVCCCSAESMYVPPLIIFKGKQLVLADGAPEDSIVAMSETGYIT